MTVMNKNEFNQVFSQYKDMPDDGILVVSKDRGNADDTTLMWTTSDQMDDPEISDNFDTVVTSGQILQQTYDNQNFDIKKLEDYLYKEFFEGE